MRGRYTHCSVRLFACQGHPHIALKIKCEESDMNYWFKNAMDACMQPGFRYFSLISGTLMASPSRHACPSCLRDMDDRATSSLHPSLFSATLMASPSPHACPPCWGAMDDRATSALHPSLFSAHSHGLTQSPCLSTLLGCHG